MNQWAEFHFYFCSVWSSDACFAAYIRLNPKFKCVLFKGSGRNLAIYWSLYGIYVAMSYLLLFESANSNNDRS